ncbi:MAG: hypothetical protein ACK41C_07515 [Phenylobacterium sp.]|uniref:hypothetical protein n=1 Tax=Phenylobacterium sp. TaxID=1871053 RepID=UPI00391CB529
MIDARSSRRRNRLGRAAAAACVALWPGIAGAAPVGDPIGALLDDAAPAAVAADPATSAPRVDDVARPLDPPRSAVDMGYEARLRASFAAAQGLQGPLDGAWSLRGAGDEELYGLLLVDANGRLEGAWRDPRRPGAAESSGFLAEARRDGAGVTLAFRPSATRALVLRLTPSADGVWVGELEEAGERRPVRLRRD